MTGRQSEQINVKQAQVVTRMHSSTVSVQVFVCRRVFFVALLGPCLQSVGPCIVPIQFIKTAHAFDPTSR